MPTEVKDHIIVICSSMDDMQHLMRPIRCSDKVKATDFRISIVR